MTGPDDRNETARVIGGTEVRTSIRRKTSAFGLVSMLIDCAPPLLVPAAGGVRITARLSVGWAEIVTTPGMVPEVLPSGVVRSGT